jgi:hypothetical protein
MSFLNTCTASAISQKSQNDLIDIRKQCACPPEDVVQKYSSYADRTRAVRQIASERCCPTWTLGYAIGALDVSGISGELFQLVGGIPVGQPALLQLLPDSRTLNLLPYTEPVYKVKPSEPYQIIRLLTTGAVAATITLTWMENPPPS